MKIMLPFIYPHVCKKQKLIFTQIFFMQWQCKVHQSENMKNYKNKNKHHKSSPFNNA